MTDPLEVAAELIRTQLGGIPVKRWMIRRCPKCARRVFADRYTLPGPCPLCQPVDGYGDMYGLMLAKEFGLSAKAYQDKLEREGPPWVNPKAWIQPRSKWPKLSRPKDDEGGGVHHAP